MAGYEQYADDIIDATDNDVFCWNSGADFGTPVIITYSFDVDVDEMSSDIETASFGNTLLTSQTDYSHDGQNAVRSALDAWDAVSGVKFVEVDDYEDAQIYLSFGNLNVSFGGVAQSPYISLYSQSHAYNLLNEIYQDDIDTGSYGYEVLLHELGHNLGLGHPHESETDIGQYDSTNYTVMSYNHEGDFKVEPQVLDIAAIQLLYGTQADESSAPWVYDEASNTAFYQGGLGDDRLNGSGLDEMLRGSQGKDTIAAGHGDDTVRGGKDDDTIGGNSGDDLLFGDIGHDYIFGGTGNDHIEGGRISSYAGDDNDRLSGVGGDDYIQGNLGDDTVDGGIGNDTLRGGQGDDMVYAGYGADLLYGDLGDDTLKGGRDADLFVFGENNGSDLIKDFDYSEGDRLEIRAGYSSSENSSGVTLTIDGGGTVFLEEASGFSEGWVV